MNTNTKPIETFVVGKADQAALKITGSLITGSNINLNDGQLGFLAQGLNGSVALNNFMDATPTIAESRYSRLVQGTPFSGSVGTSYQSYPLAVRSYEQSELIDWATSITVTKQAYRAPSHAITVVGNAVGNAAAINVASNTEYEMSLALRGRRIEEDFSVQESAYIRSSVMTPDFSATGLNLTTAQATSWIVSNMVVDLNKKSAAFGYNSRFGNNGPFIALAIDTTGGAGKAIGTASPLTAGDVITVCTINGVAKTMTVTEDMANAIKAAAVAGQGAAIASVTWTIENASTATASTAGNEMIMIVALDQLTAYDDRIPQVKVDIKVNLPLGFNYQTVRNTKYTFADEGQGLARQLEFLYQNSAQAKYALEHDLEPEPKYPSPIVANQKYTLYSIRHDIDIQNGYGSRTTANKLTRVAIPTFSTGSTPNPAIALFDTALASYLTSGNNGAVINLD